MVLHIPPGFHPAMLAMSDGGRYFYLLARKVGDRSWERDDCERPGPMSRSPEMGLYLVFAAHFSLFCRKFLPRSTKPPLYLVLAAFTISGGRKRKAGTPVRAPAVKEFFIYSESVTTICVILLYLVLVPLPPTDVPVNVTLPEEEPLHSLFVLFHPVGFEEILEGSA